ncbi:hypothetical protein K488DRAFT_85813 [Vararia minispora EC-137]|uniref:Uncharacterized protein n=1 Tax=Vararia minispora EC-137 TaxID=1314806 RepID=A0ACB8QLC7_9AGAM|nr:hypothetical protein K488DRAFT_85813 [Vararia minispora EC-137]
MSDPNHIPTIVIPILFSPLKNCRSPRAQFERNSLQQPLPFDHIPDYLLRHWQVIPAVVPPKLWCGWRFSAHDLAKIAEGMFPDLVARNCLTGELDVDAILHSGRLLPAIQKVCDIPHAFARLLDIVEVVHPGGGGLSRQPDIVLSVGKSTAEVPVMPREGRDRVGRMFANGACPQWHLDSFEWHWDRRESHVISPLILLLTHLLPQVLVEATYTEFEMNNWKVFLYRCGALGQLSQACGLAAAPVLGRNDRAVILSRWTWCKREAIRFSNRL